MTITCREVADFLMDYLSDSLPYAQREQFEGHLAICPACITYMRTYQETVRLGREAFLQPNEPVPSTVPERLVRAIMEARRRG